ncbi:hypothetical protein [Oryzobacter telluris]|uniref:hypothetical protein n=1 Tax=Oryzobacter telluris TaxID=3149179 RepID=UPI00370D8979
MPTLGETFAHAVAAKDHDAVRAVLAPDVDFRALTPRRPWEGSTPDDVLDALFGHWFEESDEVRALLDVETGEPVEDTERVAYRLALHNDDGDFTLEQQVYYRHDGERITYLRVLCSGYRPTRRADSEDGAVTG